MSIEIYRKYLDIINENSNAIEEDAYGDLKQTLAPVSRPNSVPRSVIVYLQKAGTAINPLVSANPNAPVVKASIQLLDSVVKTMTTNPNAVDSLGNAIQQYASTYANQNTEAGNFVEQLKAALLTFKNASKERAPNRF